MKKIFLYLLIMLLLQSSAQAAGIPSLKLKNISHKKYPLYSQTDNRWIAVKSKNKTDSFDTGYEMNFLYQGRLISYSNDLMKFYEFIYNNGEIKKNELGIDDIKTLCPNYKLIKISDFSNNTNSLKIKKHFKNLKLAIINDTEQDFANYKFTSGNTEFKIFKMNGFIEIKKKGMIHFAYNDESVEQKPWYVILVR